MEKVFIITNLGTQLNGGGQFVKIEAAFNKASDADAYINKLPKIYREVVNTPNGNVECDIQRGIIEVEVK